MLRVVRAAGSCLFALTALATGCADVPQQVLVQIDAADEVVQRALRVRVVATVGGEERDSFEVVLEEEAPRCLPFSFVVLAERVERDSPFQLMISIDLDDGRTITTTTDSRFGRDLVWVPIELSAACLERGGCPFTAGGWAPIDAEAAAQMVAESTCRPRVLDARACLLAGGCFGETGASCLDPCPEVRVPEEPGPPIGPLPAVYPALTRCPEGWTRIDDEPIDHCEPWPIDAPPECDPGTFRPPSASSCISVTSACDGGWPNDLPVDARYVRPGATGVGTRADPMGDLAQAVVGGGTIALAPGVHSVATGLRIDTASALIGCEDALIRNVSGSAGPTLMVAASVSVRGVGIVGPVAVEGGAGVTLDESIVSGFIDIDGRVDAHRVLLWGALRLAGDAVLTASTAVLRGAIVAARAGAIDLRDFALGGFDERAILATAGTDVRLTRGVIEHVAHEGMRLEGGSPFEADWLIVRDVSNEGNDAGVGIRLRGAGTSRISRSWFEALAYQGLRITETASVTLRDVGIRNVEVDDPRTGDGILFVGGALTADRLLVQQTHRRALTLEESTADLSDISILGVDVEADTASGIGAFGSSLTLERARIDDLRGTGLHLDSTSTATVTQLSVTHAENHGVLVEAGAQLDLSFAKVSDTETTGLDVRTNMSSVAHVAVRFLHVQGTAGIEVQGRGIQVGRRSGGTDDRPADVELMNVTLEDCVDTGLHVTSGDVQVDGLSVTGTREVPGYEFDGAGIFALGPNALVRGKRIVLDRNINAGARIDQGTLSVEDLVVTNTGIDTQVEDSNFFGAGLYFRVATADIRFLRIEDNARYGVQIFQTNQIDLRDGVIRGHQHGIDIRQVGHDLVRLSRGVTLDNEINVFTTAE